MYKKSLFSSSSGKRASRLSNNYCKFSQKCQFIWTDRPSYMCIRYTCNVSIVRLGDMWYKRSTDRSSNSMFLNRGLNCHVTLNPYTQKNKCWIYVYFTHSFNAQTNYLLHAVCKMPLVQQVANSRWCKSWLTLESPIGHRYIYLVQCDVFLSVEFNCTNIICIMVPFCSQQAFRYIYTIAASCYFWEISVWQSTRMNGLSFVLGINSSFRDIVKKS